MPLQDTDRARPIDESTATKSGQTSNMSENQGPVIDRQSFLRAMAAAAFAQVVSPLAGVVQAQGTTPEISYAKALESVIGKLDRQGERVKVASKLLTDKQLNQLVAELKSGTGAPQYVAQLPGDFSNTRLSEFGKCPFPVPFINPQGGRSDDYAVASHNAHANFFSTAKEKNLKVFGVTPLDHQKALYAVAVEEKDGNKAWIIAQVTETFAPQEKHGYGPPPAAFKAALPRILKALPETKK